jgi:hypothetical protein
VTKLKLLIAIDPGKATGYAFFNFTDIEKPKLVESLELTVEELWDTLESDLNSFTGAQHEVHVVFEEFKITTQTGKNSDAPWSLENIGVFKFLCRKYDVTWSQQGPAQAKTFVTNERLHALEMWHKGGAGHANDAIRHGVLWLVTQANYQSRDLLI